MKGRLYLAIILAFGLACAGISSGCGGGGAKAIKTVNLETGGMQETFALFYPVPFNATGHVVPYQVSPGLSNVAGTAGVSLPANAPSDLVQNGFLVTSGGEEKISAVYQKMPGGKFVTLDSLLYAVRALDDYSMQFLERQTLDEDLRNLLASLTSTLEGIYEGSQGVVKEAASKDLGFMGVAARLMGSEADVPSGVAEAVDKELSLIKAHQGRAISPLFGFEGDYSIYAPSGHYLGSEETEAYFQAMTWLSEVTFPPRPGASQSEVLRGRNSTREAMLLVAALQAGDISGEKAMKTWDRIYQPSSFLTGVTNVLNVYTYGKVALEEFGPDLQLSRLGDDSQIDAFIDAVLARAALSSSGESGPRPNDAFTLFAPQSDIRSKIFQKLVEPAVPERTMPRGLDIMAAYGSDRAFEILDTLYKETEYESYADNVRILRGDASLDPSETHGSAYSNTMDALRVMLKAPADGYPLFMKDTAWQDRDIYSCLAAWSQLEKRALLWEEYDSPAPGLPSAPATVQKGYVEPRPEALALLAAQVDILKRGLSERGLATPEIGDRAELLYKLLVDFKDMAEKELNGQALSGDDYAEIAGYGNALEYITTFPVHGQDQRSQSASIACITDLYTDPVTQEALQAGLGKPSVYYVVAPVEGKPTLTIGAGFSYYELLGPVDKKFTDSSWGREVVAGQAEAQPAWTSSFLR